MSGVRVAMCPMCRVPATEEHLASDWHKYNVRVTGEGKTPMAKDLYENFEKLRVGSDSSSPAAAPAAAPPATNTKNVNQWHWEEKNVKDWAFKRLEELLKETEIPIQGGEIKITAVKDIEGDAYLNMRKGKIRVGFELKCKMEWTGEITDTDGKDVVKCTGKCILADLDDTMDNDEYEDQIQNISVEKEEAGTGVIMAVVKKLGRKSLADQLRKLVEELKAMSHTDC